MVHSHTVTNVLHSCGFGYPTLLICDRNDFAPFIHPFINHASEDIEVDFRTYVSSLLHMERNSYFGLWRNPQDWHCALALGMVGGSR
jgi:hypothetical protein